MRFPIFLAGISCLVLLYLPARAQTPGDPPTVFELFHEQSEELPFFEIESDWRQLIKNKKEEEYQKGQFRFQLPGGDTIRLDGRLRARGNIRKEVCFHPPLRIKFKKKELAKAGLDSTYNDIKMVIQCRSDGSGRQYLLREYLAYKLYECISPHAYKTRLIELHIKSEKDSENLLGFFIEKEDEYEDRLGGKVIEAGRVRHSLIDRSSYVQMCFFQYLILNNDWSTVNKHNLEFVRFDTSSYAYVIPYDFDYSGWVNAAYAAPPPQLPIKYVTQPYFRGKELTEEEVLNGARHFIDIRETLYNTCRNFSWLEEKERDQFIRLMDRFYKELADEKRLLRAFANRGRG